MRMIPDYLLHSKSVAEMRVFEKLRAIMNGKGWYAFHSLNLPRHDRKRFSEADFVICGPGGIYTLEVKGGRVSCNEGEWRTIDAKDITHPLKEPPFVQAEGALHALRNKLDAHVLRQFVFGYGVVTPDTSMENITSVEWDPAIWADSKDFRDFERWFLRLVKHWNRICSHSRNPSDATNVMVGEVAKTLRPSFDTALLLYDEIERAESRIASMTEDQLRVIDFIEANRRVICGGGAGTGKTLVAVELARRRAARGETVAFTCFSPWLKRYIETKALPGVTVSLFDDLAIDAKRAGVEKYDTLIVDEGQDLLNFESLDALGTFLDGDFENGRWCFFHDINNQAGVLGRYDPEALDYLKGLGTTTLPLTQNCRNTTQILDKIQSSLAVDMGNASVGNGPEVHQVAVAANESVAEVLEHEIQEILRDADFTSRDMVILSPHSFQESGAWPLRTGSQVKVRELDSYATGLSRGEIGFAAIRDYKGLESKVVFVIDLPALGDDEEVRSLHYIGMSRARALLVLIVEEE